MLCQKSSSEGERVYFSLQVECHLTVVHNWGKPGWLLGDTKLGSRNQTKAHGGLLLTDLLLLTCLACFLLQPRSTRIEKPTAQIWANGICDGQERMSQGQGPAGMELSTSRELLKTWSQNRYSVLEREARGTRRWRIFIFKPKSNMIFKGTSQNRW